MGTTDSDFPMSSMTGRASLLLTTSTGGGVHAGIKSAPQSGRNAEGKIVGQARQETSDGVGVKWYDKVLNNNAT
ncbi:hypothetical protein SY86_10865 [Erwinia tracheiphila]|uniref:Uncharacterized protein n=2 Tax=Erwinia tracheiphila TaxID=65700 RepID=A0A0M2KA56_9GAMM|nr:hypothetical protein SY86_10865 [Erwinia tracheiphila]